jgi:hypothetical protein
MACALAVHAPTPVPVVAGVVAGLAFLAVGLYYQQRRLMPVVLSSPTTIAARRGDPEAA